VANLQQRLPQNVGGDFFVDATCIDCDTCSQLAPSVFHDHGEQCSVYHQPENDQEVRLALMALVACPTGSIGTTEKHDAHIGIDAFPSLVSANVYFCGFTSEASFGGWSYLIVRPDSEGGNVLVDSPRFASQLVRRIESMGGVKRMLLTHQDDVADHQLYTEKFGCERIMHADDGARRLGVERVIEEQHPVELDDDLLAIPTPGHTRGHMVFLYRNKFLFSGDHLAWSPTRQMLTAFRTVAWYSWPEQIRSMERLQDREFEWVLPGHGQMGHDSVDKMQTNLRQCIVWMKSQS
jgi:glyoxylase-like metal-dependent hydrolase (beta-lactamase superfamily II)/ferredoxin